MVLQLASVQGGFLNVTVSQLAFCLHSKLKMASETPLLHHQSYRLMDMQFSWTCTGSQVRHVSRWGRN
jgi:hypothetical protein